MEIITIFGQILFGFFFLMMGLNHFLKMGNMVAYAKTKNVPAPVLATSFTGLLLFLGGLSIITGMYLEYGLTFLAIFFVFVTPWMHGFWADTDPNMKMQNQVNFTKNTALLGAILMMYAFIDVWPWVLTLS